MNSPTTNRTDVDAAYAGTVHAQLNRLARLNVLRAFKQTGVFQASGEDYAAPALKAQMGLAPSHERLFDLLLSILEKAQFISRNNGSLTTLGPVDMDLQEIAGSAAALRQAIERDYPEMTATLAALAGCMDQYAAVLTGKISSDEALFPNGSLELVESLYTHNAIQDFFNRLVARKVKDCVMQLAGRSADAPIALLEIGAGTGSTTRQILREIDGLGSLSYCYSDAAPAFIEHGRKRFGADYPWLRFKAFDIEEDAAVQDMQQGAWDVIIACNVLHSTARIDRTLRHVHQLLKPGGTLILNEVSRFQEIINVIFGLTSGWWRFEDPDCRIAHTPSLSLAGWQAQLRAAGFIQLEHAGLPNDSEQDPMQCVIVAQRDSAIAVATTDAPAPAAPVRAPAAPSGRRQRIAAEVRELMFQSSEIEVDDADGDINLFELGFASLMIARLKDLIKRAYGLDVQMSWFYSRLESFNKVVDFIDQESAPDSAPAQAPAVAQPAAAGARAALPAVEGADGIISRQIELMNRQLAVMAEQLSVLGGGKQALPQELLQRQAALVQHLPAGQAAVPATTPPAPRAARPAAKKSEAYVAYRGVKNREKIELNKRQQEHLKQLIGRYTGRTAGSKDLTRKYRPVFANTRNIAGFRPEWKEMIYQIIVDRAQGARFTDIDGKQYLDITMGFGVYLFGHNPPFVQAELQRQLQQGTPIGPMCDCAGQVATLIHELAGVERVAFFNTGTEAVMAAVRLARTVTGRKKVVLFSGSYHGHFDGLLAVKDFDGPLGRAVPMSPGTPPELVSEIYVLDYDSEEALQFIEAHGRELAAVLVEPVQSRKPELQPKGFLKQLREITAAAGAALIFDEMIVGFRTHPAGAQGWFGVQADIVTYGKVVGGGVPIGVVAGKAHYLDAVDGGMWHYGDKSFPERENTFIAGTFNHHPLAMAGARAVLQHLKSEGPALQENLNRRTAELARRLNAYFEGEGIPIRMTHFGSLFRIPVKGDQELLYYHLLCRGVYIWEGRNCFLSTAHTDEDIEYLLTAVRESVDEMRAGGLFPEKR